MSVICLKCRKSDCMHLPHTYTKPDKGWWSITGKMYFTDGTSQEVKHTVLATEEEINSMFKGEDYEKKRFD